MIVSNSRRFIFVHIMKAAGTSITRALEPALQWNDLVLGSTPLGEIMEGAYRKRFNLHKHSRAFEIRNTVGEELWKNYFTFAFVRHPYRRAVSLYTWLQGLVASEGWKRHWLFKGLRKRQFWHYPGTEALLESGSFADFIRNPKLVELAPGFKPQADWLLDADGRLLVDFVGKVENIVDDLQHVAERIGWGPIQLGAHNRSKPNKAPAAVIRANDFEYLQRRFSKDFEMFGYDPDPEHYVQR